jgi:hypothetical protein
MDWVLPTDEILALAKAEMMAAEEDEALGPSSISRSNGGPGHGNKAHDGIASRLRKLVFLLKQRFKSLPLHPLRALGLGGLAGCNRSDDSN